MSPQASLLDKLTEAEKLIKRFQGQQEKQKTPPPPSSDLRELLFRRRPPFLTPQLPVTRTPVSGVTPQELGLGELLRQRQALRSTPVRPPAPFQLPGATSGFAELLGQRQSISPVSARVTAPFPKPQPPLLGETDIPGGMKVLGEGLVTQFPTQVLSKLKQLTQRGSQGASVRNKDENDYFITYANERAKQFVERKTAEFGEKRFLPGVPIKITDVAQLPQNLAYSAVSGGIGATAGAPFLLIPVAGEWIFAGVTAGVSGKIAFDLTSYEIMQQYLEMKDAESLATKGRGITLDEENQLKAGFESEATKYGLWEAIPEGVSNLVGAKLILSPLMQMFRGGLVKTLVPKLFGAAGGEFATETITQKGQAGVEFRAGMRGNVPSWFEAFKEIAPQTALLLATTGGAGATVVGSAQAISSLQREIGSGHPQFTKISATIKEALAEERGGVGRPAKTLSKLATPEETVLLKNTQALASKAGLDLEAVEGIAPGEYWVSLTTAPKGKGELAEWLVTLRNKNPETANQVEKALVGKFKFTGTEVTNYPRGKFVSFKTLADAQKFLETGDISLRTKSLNLRGQPWTPEELAATRQALAEQAAREAPITNQIKALNERLVAAQAELSNRPKDMPLKEWSALGKKLDKKIDSLRKQITELGMQRLQPTISLAKPELVAKAPRISQAQKVAPATPAVEGATQVQLPSGTTANIVETDHGRIWEIRVRGERAGELIDNFGSITVFGGGTSFKVKTKAEGLRKLQELAIKQEQGILRRPRTIPKAEAVVTAPSQVVKTEPAPMEISNPGRMLGEPGITGVWVGDADYEYNGGWRKAGAYKEGRITGELEKQLDAFIEQEKLKRVQIPTTEPAPAVTAKPQAAKPLPAGKGKVPPAKPPPPAEPPVTAGQPPPAEGGFAGNIRLEKYPEEIRSFLKEWADANPDVIAQARRGVRSDTEVLADAKILADDVGGDFARMQSRWKSGDAWNAEEILALRGTLRAKTEAVLDAQKLAAQANSTENLLKLKLALEEQAAIQEAVSGVTAEAGRALRQFRQQVFEASTDAEKLERLLREVGGRDKIEDIAKLLGEIDINNPAAVNAFIRALNKPGFWDYITEIYYNSILSGPKTHIVNSLSNTFNTILSPVERGAAAIVDIPLSRWQGRPRGRFFREASADAFGAIEGIKDGFRAFGETYRTGVSPQQASKFFEVQRTRAFTGLPGRVINFPSTSLEAADSLMQAINYRAAFNATALRIVRRSGKKGAEAIEALAELKSNPTKELLKEAGRITEERLFRAPAGKTTQTIMNLRESLAVGGFKPLRYIVPFIRTPANLLKYGIERSPGGWLNPKLWKNVVAKNPEAADQIGRAVLGSLAAMAIALYVLEDKITGAAPTNSAERDRFYRDGKQPFSIKIGDNWIAYQRLEPFNQAFASVAATLGAIKDKERDAVGKATDVANTIAQNMVSQTYLSGLSSVLDALAQPERYASRILTRFGTALVIPASSFTRTVAQMVDRTVRQPQNVVEEFKASVPGLSKQVPARLTAFGEEVTRKTPAWSPINISPSEETPLTRELDRLKINTGFTGKTIAGVPLTLDEQRAYQIQAGQKSKEFLTALISNPAYNSLSDVEKEKAIKARIDKARDLVRTAILAGIPPAERVSRIKRGVKTGVPVQAAPITPLAEEEEEKKPPKKKKVFPRY